MTLMVQAQARVYAIRVVSAAQFRTPVDFKAAGVREPSSDSPPVRRGGLKGGRVSLRIFSRASYILVAVRATADAVEVLAI